ncbi:flagellar hook protein FliD [Burkholderia sp. PAMC 28687]|uniref:Flagellar hook-associated protein 2 n=1 Tax=Caballeronia sordidicola TaxID=196367 RepID=A0A242N1T0_CABSO|nr:MULTISPECIES: flagellar filament capping protein FliD [Burkholderiaceae]AMM14693.1 flagellar hook protein FliD [Burkholderia sp. PAMC 28687]OTP77640.1 Flagellar hook-associated protein FliD [Caballeronia sordidicola]
MSTVAGVSTSTVDPNSALQQAAQSIISGSTNSTMDVNSLVSAIVSAKVAGQTDAITNKTNTDNTQLSAVGSLKSILSLLQSSLSTLADGTALTSYTASADGKGLTASTTAGAVPGSYDVAVSNIAKSQSITSGKFTTGASLGTGTMQLSVGGKSTSITIDSSNNTIDGIAAAINSASGNPGITAAVVNGTDGAHLVLRSSSTGVANGIAVSITGSGSSDALNNLNVTSGQAPTPASTVETDPSSYTGPIGTSITGGSANWTQSVSGVDAHFTIAGTAASSASNTITAALSGVSVTLTSAAVGTTQTITVAQDTTGLTTTLNSFVTAYNNYVSTVKSLTSFDSTATKGSQGGTLLGDSMLNAITSTISSLISGGVGTGSSKASLAAIGISLQPDGTLKTDAAALGTAVTSGSATLSTLFNAKTGVASKLNASLTSILATGGAIDTRTTALNADLKSLTDQQTSLTAYTAELTTSYNAQFTALNTLMSQTANNANYLTALFGGTNSAGALATNK